MLSKTPVLKTITTAAIFNVTFNCLIYLQDIYINKRGYLQVLTCMCLCYKGVFLSLEIYRISQNKFIVNHSPVLEHLTFIFVFNCFLQFNKKDTLSIYDNQNFIYNQFSHCQIKFILGICSFKKSTLNIVQGIGH